MNDIFETVPKLRPLKDRVAAGDEEACALAVSILRESAENGNLEHLHYLLDEYMEGGELNGFKPDFTLARHFASLAVAAGSLNGKLALARIWQNGYQGDPEPERAEEFYRQLEGSNLELQAAFYRSHPYASVVDYLEYLVELKSLGKSD